MRQVLTIEQSVQLRKQIYDQEKAFHGVVEEKDNLIKSQQKLLDKINSELPEKEKLLNQLSEVNKSYEESFLARTESLKKVNEENAKLLNEKIDLMKKTEQAEKRAIDFELTTKEIIDKNNSIENDSRKKDEEIKNLKRLIQNYGDIEERVKDENELNNVLIKVKNTQLKNSFSSISLYIQKYRGDLSDLNVPTEHIAFFEGYGIIEQLSGKYTFTSRGKEFLKLYSSDIT